MRYAKRWRGWATAITISRADAEQRMLEKLTRSLTEDVDPLLPAGVRFSEDDAIEATTESWNATPTPTS